MTIATDVATEWNAVVSAMGDTITLYDPTIAYNDEGDVSSYTLGSGTSTTAVVRLESGIEYSREVEGVDDKLNAKVLFGTTESVDEETIIKWNSEYFTLVGGSLMKPRLDDTVIAQKAMLSKMLDQEVAKIA